MLPGGRANRPGTVGGELQGTKLAVSIAVVLDVVTLMGVVVCIILLGILTDNSKDLKIQNGGDCYDGNTCTVDIEREEGGCLYLAKPPGHACTSECYDPTPDLACHYLELTKGVLTPKCHSDTLGACRGTCEADVDCPDLPTADGPVMGECFDNTCYYVRDQTSETFDADEIPDLVCTPDAEIFNRYCETYLNTSGDIVADHCITWDVQCEDASLDPMGTAAIPVCYYYFWCSVQEYTPIVLKKRQIESAVPSPARNLGGRGSPRPHGNHGNHGNHGGNHMHAAGVGPPKKRVAEKKRRGPPPVVSATASASTVKKMSGATVKPPKIAIGPH